MGRSYIDEVGVETSYEALKAAKVSKRLVVPKGLKEAR